MFVLSGYFLASLLTDSYPQVITLVFLAVYFSSKIPAKALFLVRAFVALVIAVCFAHLNRWFYLWPAHLLFPSGHMTYCLGVSVSLAMLRPWTLAITLPVLVPFGLALIAQHFHTAGDVLGAIPLVAIVYGLIHGFWRLPTGLPPLDMQPDSP